MQTVADWKKGISSSNTTSTGFTSVADWKKTRTISNIPINNFQPKPDLLDKVKTSISNYATDSAKTVDTLGNAILHPIDTIKKLPGVFIDPLKAGIKKASTPVEGGNIVTDVANLFTGVAESLFSPITGAFTIAENIPGAKQVADTISLPFLVLGTGTSFTIGKVLDNIPESVLSKETKDVIKQPLQEAGATIAQVTLGGKVMDIIGKKMTRGEKITPEVAKKVVEQVKKEVDIQKPVDIQKQTKVTTPIKPLSVSEWKSQGKPEASTLTVEPVKPTVAPKQPLAKGKPTVRPVEDRIVQRIEEPGVSVSFDKPQGLYTTPSKVTSPHLDLGGKRSEFVIKPGVKEVTVDTSKLSFAERGIDQAATNLVWLRQSFPKIADDIRGRNIRDLRTIFSKEFPKTEWTRYIEKQDMIEGYAGLKARQQGIDIIRGINKTDPAFSEVVILNKDAVTQKPTPTLQNKVKGEKTTVPKTETTKPKKQDVTFESTIGVSGLAKSVKSKAIKDKMIFAFDKRFRNLPEFEKRIKSEDLKKATEFTLNDPNGAFEIAMGNKKAPNGMLPEDIFVAVNEFATQTKNVDVLIKLANESKLTGEATLMGQRIQALSQLNPDSVGTKLKDIKKARQNKIKNHDKRKGSVVKTLKDQAKKVHLSKAELSWDKFLKEITC